MHDPAAEGSFLSERPRKDPITGQEREQRVKLDRPIQRLYSVFNAKQIDGVPALAPQQREEWQAIEAAERALKNSGAKITHKGTEAFYQPSSDKITMPPKKAFPDQAAYYGTALHELAHWTGHESRLNRDGITGRHAFGSEGYAREELRAEMASVFLQALTTSTVMPPTSTAGSLDSRRTRTSFSAQPRTQARPQTMCLTSRSTRNLMTP